MKPRIVGQSDALLALFVLAIAVMLLVPLPTMALDMLLAFNISFSLLLLLVGLYMPNTLALLAFPSLLLLTTLFRLALSVASTRLILTQADAGRVIDAFGSFLIRGEIVVGMIIFTIVTLVNFIVIARGSSRVSEVAARFALDALPGKQMAIDSDMRAGIIDPPEAQRRREELRKESQLFGSMDGAMKFVQGDAIAGFFIIATNILGGLYVGLKAGSPIGDVVSTYTRLTVGDGLVHQIPALLISICAGIVVTRVSSGENTTLASDLSTQLFRSPLLLIIAAVIVSLLGLLPGLPLLPFLFVAALFVGTAFWIRRESLGEDRAPWRESFGGTSLVRLIDGEEYVIDEGAAVLRLDAAVLYPRYESQAQEYRRWWRDLQADYLQTVGLHLPDVRIEADSSLAGRHFVFSLGGTTIDQGELPDDALLVEVNPDSVEYLGLRLVKAADHPLSGSRVSWVAAGSTFEKIAEAMSLQSYDFVQFALLRFAVFLNRHPEEVLALSDVHNALKQLEKSYPGLLSDSIHPQFLQVARLTEILQQLVREGVNIRDFRQMIEALAVYCSTVGSALVKENDFDLQDIVGFVRHNRRRHILNRLLSYRGTLKVLTLSPELEQLLESVRLQDGTSGLRLESETTDQVTEDLKGLIEPLAIRGLNPVSILCRSELRAKIDRFIRSARKDISIVTSDELDSNVPLETVGVWSI